jgi:hypothetical protein
MKTLRQERLVDALVEAYVDWRETCACVNDAYRSWASKPSRSTCTWQRSTRNSTLPRSTPGS